MSWSSSDWGETIRVIAKQGANELVYTKRGLDGPGYYLYRTVNVTAGQVNRYVLDGSQTVAANVSFSYDSNAMQYTEVFFDLSGKDWPSYYSRRRVGTIYTSGQQTVYVTPGTYDVYFRGYSNTNQLLYLGQKAISMSTDFSTSYNWTDSDTGLLNFTTSFDSLSNFGGKQIALSGQYINFGQGSTVRLNPGTYSVEELLTVDNHYSPTYFFEKNINDFVDINAASTTNYAVDLSLNSLKLSFFGEVVEPGDMLGARVETISGYHLAYISGGYAELDISITTPNGTNTTYSDDFYIYYQVPSIASDGSHTMTVSGDFGPLYGGYRSVSADFEVMSRPTVAVSSRIIPLGQVADVTFTLTRSDGTPLTNTDVYLGDFQINLVGTTNASGQLTVTMQRETTTDLSFSVRGFYYESLLFFLDVDTEGVVEVSANDTGGNPISYFSINAFSDDLGWKGYSSGGTAARAVAKAGQVQVVFAKSVHGEGVAYYLTKTVTVSPGQVNTVHFNGSDSVPVTLSVNYLGSPMENNYIILKAAGFTNELFNSNHAEHYEMIIGTMSSGSKSIRVTPGTYDAIVSQFWGSPLFYLKKNQLDFNSQTAVNIDWDASNTSSVEIAPVTNQAEAECTTIFLNGNLYFLDSTNTIVVSPGQHVIDSISIYYDSYVYNFALPADSGTTLNYTSAGQTYSFSPDLRQAETTFDLASSSVAPGGVIEFTLSDPVTPSGYLVKSIYHQGESLKNVNVLLKDSDGTLWASTTVPYDSGSISTDAAWPAGTYTLYAERNLGPLFGSLTTSTSLYIGPPPVNYDVNNDGQVSYADLQEVSTHYSAESANTGYQASSDLNGDGVINLFDLVLLARQLTPLPQPPRDEDTETADTTGEPVDDVDEVAHELVPPPEPTTDTTGEVVDSGDITTATTNTSI